MKCPTCHQEKTSPIDIEAIEKIGECLSCDHVRADVLDSQKNELAEEENYDN